MNFEILFIDKNLNVVGRTKLCTSFQWTENYESAGSFELHFLPEVKPLLKKAVYVCRKDNMRCGIVDKRKSSYKDGMITGLLMESLFDERVHTNPEETGTKKLEGSITQKGFLSDVVAKIVAEYSDMPRPDTSQNIKYLKIGSFSRTIGADNWYSFECGIDLSTTLRNALNEQQLSYRLDIDLVNKQIIFIVWQGMDRTVSNKLVFSKTRYNIENEVFSETVRSKSFAYIKGPNGYIAEPLFTTTWLGENEEALEPFGQARNEMIVDATSINKETKDGNNIISVLTDEDLIKAMKQKGQEALKEQSDIGDTIEFDIIDFNVDCDIGDKCIYKSQEYDVEITERITSIREVIEPNQVKKEITFGKEILTIQKYIKRGA